jgi:hypothetical protein
LLFDALLHGHICNSLCFPAHVFEGHLVILV